LITRRPSLTAREISLLVVVGMVGLAITAILLSVNLRWTSVAPGGESFFSSWAGARAYLFSEQDPYGLATAAEARALAFPNAEADSAVPYRLGLPFFVLPVFFPIAAVSDPTLARALWLLISEVALAGVILLSVRGAEWHPSRPTLVAFALLSFFSYPSIEALGQGSPVILLVLGYMGILWAMRVGREELAGALLAFCLCYWEVGLPFLVLVAGRVFRERRWRVLAGTGMTLGFLLLVSFLLFPRWLMPFLVATVAQVRSNHGMSTRVALDRLLPDHGLEISLVFAIVAIGLLLLEWAAARSSDPRRVAWTASFALAVAPLLGWRTESSHLIALVPSYALICAASVQRKHFGSALAILLMVLTYGVPWLLFWRSFALPDQLAADMLFLFPPLFAVVTMYWTRWWFLRPQRTWLDALRSSGS
jgi:hypothetical protein